MANLVDAGMAISMELLTVSKDTFLNSILELVNNKKLIILFQYNLYPYKYNELRCIISGTQKTLKLLPIDLRTGLCLRKNQLFTGPNTFIAIKELLI